MPLVRFGVFELDPERGELRRQGRRVHLAGQALKVLGLLTARAGEVVTRDELQHHLWEPGTFVEFDRGLNFCIASVRAALNDDARRPRFIETLPKRGYRFIADVRVEIEPVADAPREFMPIARSPFKRWRRWGWAAALPLLVAQYPAGARAHSRATTRADARAAFERGLAATTQGPAGARRGIYAFREAARLDPRFAEAHYALADTYLDLASRRELPPEPALAEARASALAAVTLEDVASSRVVLGTTRLLHDWDWDGARRDFERAVALAPRWDAALVSLARIQSAAGDDRAALELIDRAETISPACDLILFDSGVIHARAGRIVEAVGKFESAIAFGPPHGRTPEAWQREVLPRLLSLHASRRDWPAARAQAVAILELSGGSAGARARFAAMDPQQAVALFLRNSLEHIRQRAGPAAVSPTRVAALYALVGRDQLAAGWFERGATAHG